MYRGLPGRRFSEGVAPRSIQQPAIRSLQRSCRSRPGTRRSPRTSKWNWFRRRPGSNRSGKGRADRGDFDASPPGCSRPVGHRASRAISAPLPRRPRSAGPALGMAPDRGANGAVARLGGKLPSHRALQFIGANTVQCQAMSGGASDPSSAGPKGAPRRLDRPSAGHLGLPRGGSEREARVRSSTLARLGACARIGLGRKEKVDGRAAVGDKGGGRGRYDLIPIEWHLIPTEGRLTPTERDRIHTPGVG